MKLFTFALLLVVAGASASQDVEGGYGNRLADLVVKDFIERLIDTIIRRGYDPYHNEHYDFEIVLIERKAEARGHLKQVNGFGISNIQVLKLKYNYLFSILEFDIVWPHIQLSLGGSEIELVFDDARGHGTASGSLGIRNLGISGTAHLTRDLSGNAQIISINPDLKVGRIEADLKIVGSNNDYSETINHFLNVRVEELGKKYKLEINTLLGEAIKLAYAWLKGW